MQKGIEILKQNHYKITKQRQSILEYLCHFPHYYIEVTELDAHIREIYPHMSYDTIYRNIKDFEKLGIIETKEGSNGKCVKYQCDFDQQKHHHFICKKCQKVLEIKICPLNNLLEQQLPGCQIDGHLLEVSGICATCLAQGN